MNDTAVRTSYVDLTISSDDEPPKTLEKHDYPHVASHPRETVDISSDDEAANLTQWQVRKERATAQSELPLPQSIQAAPVSVQSGPPYATPPVSSGLQTSGLRPLLKRTRDGELKPVAIAPLSPSSLTLSPQTGPLVCPHTSCNRSRPEAAYKKGWMLKEHLERVHRQQIQPPLNGSSPTSLPVRSSNIPAPHANEIQSTTQHPKPESIPQALPKPISNEVDKLVADMKQVLSEENYNVNRHYREPEDKLIVFLKETLSLGWVDIYKYFPHRQGKNLLECRYSAVLKKRKAPWQRSIGYSTPSSSLSSKVRSGTPISRVQTPESESNHFSGQNRRSFRKSQMKVSYSQYYPESLANRASSQSDPSLSSDNEHHEPILPGTSARKLTISRSKYPVRISRAPIRKADVDFGRLALERDRDAALVASLSTTILRPPTPFKQSKPGYDLTTSIRMKRRPSLTIHRPYLRIHERNFVQSLALWDRHALQSWSGSILHVGFSDEEVEDILRYIPESIHINASDSNEGPKDRALACLKKHSRDVLMKWIFQREDQPRILNRSANSVSGFLEDLTNGDADTECIMWLGPDTQQYPNRSRTTIDSFLRERELGQRRSARNDLQVSCFGLHATFHGTSGDAHALAWSQNGDNFAVGSTAITDTHSMQYNMACNLLIGSAEDLNLLELPRHAVRREPPMAGTNSLPAMRATQEPFLFTSVSSMAFSPSGQRMYSAGYDDRLRAWDIRGGISAQEINNIAHDGPIDVLAVGRNGLVATGAKSVKDPVRIFQSNLHQISTLSSRHSGEQKSSNMFPTALAFGDTFSHLNNYLLCGFSSHDRDYGPGDAVVLDIERNTPYWITCRSVFDATWSPCTFGRFAIASVAGTQANRGIKSIVRVFDSRYLVASRYLSVNAHRTVELECPALDINDTRFNPKDAHLISAGCTNGKAYVWDMRKSGTLLHSFGHGASLMPLDESRRPEEVDTGVRFLSWSQDGRQLYTGSSDGIVSVWDPYRSTDDCFIGDVARLKSGVMSGSFSPDYSKLLLGEVNSSFSMLSLGRGLKDDDEEAELPKFSLNRATGETDLMRASFAPPGSYGEDADDSGVKISQSLVKTNQISIHPCGGYPFLQAVQGPNYSGPFSTVPEVNELRSSAEAFQASLVSQETPHALGQEAPKATEEEFGDMGYWKARVPAIRRQQHKENEEGIKCFRCGLTNLSAMPGVDEDLNFLECQQCNLVWQANILGYTFLGGVNFGGDKDASLGEKGRNQETNNENIGMEQDDIDFCHDHW